jgi:hypothetical protein
MSRTKAQRRRIAELNDVARRAWYGFAHVYETQGFGALLLDDRQRARLAVEQYDAFDFATDPDGEHDYGRIYRLANGKWVTGAEQRANAVIVVCWKFDYFDRNWKHPSLEPWDTEVTRRKLTLGLEEEMSG